MSLATARSLRVAPLLVLVLALCTRARAQPSAQSQASLAWSVPAPAGCLDPAAIERTVEARLGRRVFVQAPAVLHIDARFTQASGQPSVQLDVIAPSGERLGERSLSAASCAELQSSLPVVIAVLLDLEREPSPTAAPAVPAPKAATPDPPAGTAVGAVPDAGGVAFELALFVQGALGLQPGLAPGLGLAARLELAPPLAVAAWLELRLPTAIGTREQLQLQTGGLGAGLCLGGAVADPLVASACAGAGALRLRADGRGFRTPAPDARWVGEARLMGALGYPLLAPVSLRLETGVATPFQRPHYGYADEAGVRRELYRARPIAWLVQLGISARWQ